jgi:hypothetical protein
MRREHRGPWAVGRVAALAAAVLAAACARSPVPARLGGLSRGKVVQGERAARLVAELHGRDVAPVTSTVAEYGRGAQLTLYVSAFADGAEANRILAAMLARLASGATPFSPPRELRETPGHWFTVGPGGHHALWAADHSVYWVTGDPQRLRQAVGELPSPPTGAWT